MKYRVHKWLSRDKPHFCGQFKPWWSIGWIHCTETSYSESEAWQWCKNHELGIDKGVERYHAQTRAANTIIFGIAALVMAAFLLFGVCGLHSLPTRS